jgi:trk system potassium uptake protein
MRVLIMGCGRVGSELSHALGDAGHDVTVIDKRADAFDHYPPGEHARRIVGLGFDRDVLEEAGIRDADAFIAVSSGDNSNILSARVALEHYHVPKVIARIFDPRRAEIYERLNIPTVATTTWGVKQIQLMLLHTGKEVRESLGGGELLRVRGHEVTLIEQDRPTVEDLRAEVPEVNVMLGDACEPWVLEDAQLAEADVVVAATGDDEDNLVTSLLAKQEFAVPHVLARVNHPKNEWLFTDQWGVDTAVSPPHMLTSMVEEAVTTGDMVQLLRVEGGRISIVEMKLEADSPAAGRPLYELRLPNDTAIVAILRDGHVVIPQPETVFGPNDELLALAGPASERALRDAIVGD